MLQKINALYINTFNDIQEFFYSNNLLLTACGYTIGITTYNFITSTLQIFIPFFIYIGKYILNTDLLYFGINKSGFIYITIIKIAEILLNTFVWLFTMFMTFVLLEYVLYNKIIGLKTTIKEATKTDYVISKISAKKEQAEPIEEKAEKIKLKELSENIIGENIIKKQEKITENIVLGNTKNIDIKPVEEFHDFKKMMHHIL